MATRDLAPFDPLWPPGLDDLGPEAPLGLRYRGRLPPPDGIAIAIVGTRRPSPDGVELARRWSQELAEAGVVIWSGGAVGIDAAAHEGALDAGGTTVAVLGSGLEQGFPPQNAGLFSRIVARGGAVVSCLPDEVTADRPHFFQRNGVLAACTGALLIVEAGLPSGTANAAKMARQLERPVAVVPWLPLVRCNRGNAMELTEHRAWPVFTPDQVLSLATRGTTAALREPRAKNGVGKDEDAGSASPRSAAPRALATGPEPTDPLERRVLALLRQTPMHVDALCVATTRSAPEIGRALFALAVEGRVRERTPGLWTSA